MRDSAAIKSYHRRRLLTRALGLSIFIGYTAAWIAIAPWLTDPLARGGHSRWMVLFVVSGLYVAGLELATLPLTYYRSFILEHQFDLSNETRSHWLRQMAKGWLVGGLLSALLVATLYGLLWYGGLRWWVWVWAVWMILAVGLARLFPVLILPFFYPSRPVEDEALVRRLADLAEGTGITIRGVFSLVISEETRTANAMLAGLGSTRRVYLSDTLLDAFTPEQVEVVFAHELAHHVRGHIWKGLLLSAVGATLLVGVIAWRLDFYRGPDAALWPAAVAELPAVMLAAAAVQLLLQPFLNAVSRHFERECDRYALFRTNDPQAYREMFEKLGEMNLADPHPSRLVEILTYDHPALARRIALADSYTQAGT